MRYEHTFPAVGGLAARGRAACRRAAAVRREMDRRAERGAGKTVAGGLAASVRARRAWRGGDLAATVRGVRHAVGADRRVHGRAAVRPPARPAGLLSTRRDQAAWMPRREIRTIPSQGLTRRAS